MGSSGSGEQASTCFHCQTLVKSNSTRDWLSGSIRALAEAADSAGLAEAQPTGPLSGRSQARGKLRGQGGWEAGSQALSSSACLPICR